MVIVLLDKSYLLLQDATRTESGRKQAQHHVSTQHARQHSSSESSSSRPPVSTQHARQVSSSDSSSSRPPIFFFGFFFIRKTQTDMWIVYQSFTWGPISGHWPIEIQNVLLICACQDTWPIVLLSKRSPLLLFLQAPEHCVLLLFHILIQDTMTYYVLK